MCVFTSPPGGSDAEKSENYWSRLSSYFTEHQLKKTSSEDAKMITANSGLYAGYCASHEFPCLLPILQMRKPRLREEKQLCPRKHRSEPRLKPNLSS